MNTQSKYKRGDTAYILMADGTCETLKIGRAVYNREFDRWEYHCAGWVSTFFENEISPTPIIKEVA